MKKNHLIIIALVVVSILSLAAPTPAPSAQPIKLNTVTALPENSVSNLSLWMLRDKVAAKSKGQLVIDFRGGPEVIAAFDQGTAVKNGAVDLSYDFTAAYAGLVRIASVLPLSRLSATEERTTGFYKFLADQSSKAGLNYLGRGALTDGARPFFYVWVSKKITSPKQLSGLKIGGINASCNSFLTALGAVPQVIPAAEMYVAMQTGVIDGVWSTYATFTSMSLSELKPYLIDHPYYNDNMAFIMNPNTWNKLSQPLKDVLTQSVLEIEKEAPDRFNKQLIPIRQKMLDTGVQVITFSSDDAKSYVDTAYNAEWDVQNKRLSDLAAKAKELLAKK